MRIALDYDDTFTRDEHLWRLFVEAATSRGHSVTFVTSRADDGHNQDIEADAQLLGLRIVYTAGEPKSEHFTADVWIDDMPIAIPSLAALRFAGMEPAGANNG